MTPDDDRPRPDAGVPAGGEVEWTEEERRLLSDLEAGASENTTEAIRRLVLGILAQVRGAAPRKAARGLHEEG